MPHFVRTVTHNGFNRTGSVLTRQAGLPSVYNHIYPQRGRYRNGYVVGGTGGPPVGVNGLRHFTTSFRDVGRLHGPGGVGRSLNGMTMMKSNPTNLSMTNSITGLNCRMAMFRNRSRPKNMLLFNVPRFHLSGTIMHHRVTHLRKLNIGFMYGAFVNRSGALSSLFTRKCSSVFVNANARVPRSIHVRGSRMPNMFRTVCLLAGMRLMRGKRLSRGRVPIGGNSHIVVVNNNGMTVSTTHAYMHLNYRTMAMTCHHDRRRVPTLLSRCRRTHTRNIRFR